MMILAVDPGATGGAALCWIASSQLRQVRAAWAWKHMRGRRRPVYRVEHWSGHLVETEQPTLAGVGQYICGWARTYRHAAALVVEGQYGRALTLAWNAGLVASPLVPLCPKLLRPRASEWRPVVLPELPARASSKVAEAAAVDWVAMCTEGGGELRANPHVAEAICMAQWAAMTLQGGE